MKKEIILRGALGLPIGITIGYLITIFLSLAFGKGYYSPCEPELVAVMGSEIGAVILQTVLCGLLGAGFGASSIIWKLEHWSLMKQTGIYFLIVSVIMAPVAYFSYWMEHSVAGFISYFALFALIFVVVWIVQFIIGKHNVNEMNAKLQKTRLEKNE